jgi:hypothetical protein
MLSSVSEGLITGRSFFRVRKPDNAESYTAPCQRTASRWAGPVKSRHVHHLLRLNLNIILAYAGRLVKSFSLDTVLQGQFLPATERVFVRPGVSPTVTVLSHVRVSPSCSGVKCNETE